MEKFSKGFIVFAAFTAGLAAIVVILSLLVWQDSESLKNSAIMPITKQEAEIIPTSEGSAPSEPKPETETIEIDSEADSEADLPEDTVSQASFTPLMPEPITGRPEDEVTKVFTGLTQLVNPSEPLAVIEPLAELQDKSGSRYLPKISSDGIEPWQAYKKPFTVETGNKVALVVYGLGLQNDETELAISKLPAEVTLSFSPYADNLSGQITKARQAGHETMVDLPLQDKNFPAVDGGPETITLSASLEQNLTHLQNVLQNSGAFTGVTAINGNALFAKPEVINPIYEAIFSKGLLFLGTDRASSFPEVYKNTGAFLKADILFSSDMFDKAVKNNFDALENTAHARGQALMVLAPTKILLDAVVKWHNLNQERSETDRLILVPASALVKK